MRKLGIGLFIIVLYGFPFVFYSMHQDFSNGSMMGYIIMIVAVSLLAYFGRRFSHVSFLFIGNLLSAIVSFVLIGEMLGNQRWGVYFTPLTPYQLFILISVLQVIPQFMAVKLADRRRVQAR